MVIAAVAGLALPGCLGDTGGIAPPDDELIYPVALSTIRNDSHLLVVNSNSFLDYNAGTLVAYQLSAMDTIDGAALDYDVRNGIFTLPPGVTLGQYCSGGMTGAWCSLDVARGIRKDETIRLGAYASDLNITPRRDHALIPVRGERAIISVDLLDGPNLLDCGETEDDDRRCDDAHTITSNGSVTLPIEPHHVATMDYVYNKDGKEYVQTLGFATHRAGGEVSLFSVASPKNIDSTTTGIDDSSFTDNRLIKVLDGVVEGASGIAVNPRSMDIFVVGQRDLSPHVAVLDVATDWRSGGSYLTDPSFGQDRTINIQEEVYLGTGARDMAVSPDGKTGFIIIQNPAAILIADLERYKIIDLVPVCQESSRVGTFVDAGDEDDPLDDKLYAFVLCFLTSQIYIIDPEFDFTVIRKTGPGPQDIAFDATRQIAYISNFTDSTITMIQAVPPFNVIEVQEAGGIDEPLMLRIGEPHLPKGY